MDTEPIFERTTLYWPPPAPYSREVGPQFGESGTFRYDLTQVRSYCTSCCDSQGGGSDDSAHFMDPTSRETRRPWLARQRSHDSCVMDISPTRTSMEGYIMDVADEIGCRSQFAKRSRRDREGSDSMSHIKETDEEMLERGLKKICLPTVEKVSLRVKTLNGHVLHLEYAFPADLLCVLRTN